MREDMDKLLVERPRRGHSEPNLDVQRGRAYTTRYRKDLEALDDLPKKDSMKRFDWGWGKEFNENLNPLRRFLKSNVGRKWDDVYSELREHVNPGSTVQNHIMQHLWQYVQKDVVLDEEGHPCVKNRWEGGYSRLWKSHYNSQFYVHPLTGKLLEPPAHPKDPNRKPWGYNPDKWTAPDGKKFHRKNGIWFGVSSQYIGWDYDYRTYTFRQEDGTYRTESRPIPGSWAERSLTKEYQLSKKELRKYGLQNG